MFKDFLKGLNGKGPEGQLVKTIFVSLLTSFVFLGFLYLISLRYISDFFPKYGFFVFFAVLSYAIIIPSIKHIRTYGEFACMSGMMIGMTIGMVSGFLLGLYVGSTNGIFFGSVFGMVIGIFFGIWNGKYCGIMGIMEGVMAGFMGGLMGGMTAVMMINDHLKAIGVILFIVSAFILIGLNYLVYQETREIEKKFVDDNFFTVIWSFTLTAITTWFMIFGPKSTLFQ